MQKYCSLRGESEESVHEIPGNVLGESYNCVFYAVNSSARRRRNALDLIGSLDSSQTAPFKDGAMVSLAGALIKRPETELVLQYTEIQLEVV